MSLMDASIVLEKYHDQPGHPCQLSTLVYVVFANPYYTGVSTHGLTYAPPYSTTKPLEKCLSCERGPSGRPLRRDMSAGVQQHTVDDRLRQVEDLARTPL